MSRSIGPGIRVPLLILKQSCLSHLTSYNLILLGLRSSSVHETGCRCRLYLFYFYSKLCLDLLDFFAYVLQFIILWLQLLLFGYELRNHFTMNFTFLIFSQTILLNNCSRRSLFFLSIQILKPIHIFTFCFIFGRKFEFFHFFFYRFRIISTCCYRVSICNGLA